MYKDLVIPITGTWGDSNALRIAIDLATAHGAHLTVLEMLSLPASSIGAWAPVPDPTSGEVYARLQVKSQDNVAKLKSRFEKESISHEVEVIETLVEPARMAARRTHGADLAVVAGSLGDTIETATARAYFGSLLLESGRPVLVVPPRTKAPIPPRRAVVAWKPTPESARALHDAIPLLKSADAVDLVTVDESGDQDKSEQRSLADVTAHLARHGISANVVVLPHDNNAVSSVLLAHIRKARANLLVVGGYGHSRFREWAMGGVTRELLGRCPIPVLYSH